jgi:TonB family protein
MTPPKYPHYAILQRKTGTAIVAIELNDNGRVKTSKLHESSAHKILDKAVLHAARKWRFYPPVPMGEVLVPVRFELECSSNACTPKQVQQG